MPRLTDRLYLGDGVYVAFDGYGVVLTTQNGEGPPTNTIVLEPAVWALLRGWVERLDAPEGEEP
jgi:hypothetical protein